MLFFSGFIEKNLDELALGPCAGLAPAAAYAIAV
jgi:hypothetical protein